MRQAINTAALLQKYWEVFGGKPDEILKLLPQGGIGHYSALWLALKLLEQDRQIMALVKEQLPAEQWQAINTLITTDNDEGALRAAQCKYAWITDILQGAVENSSQKRTRSAFDRIATHPVWGIPLAFVMMALGFLASMVIALPFMKVIGGTIPQVVFAVENMLLHIGRRCLHLCLPRR